MSIGDRSKLLALTMRLFAVALTVTDPALRVQLGEIGIELRTLVRRRP